MSNTVSKKRKIFEAMETFIDGDKKMWNIPITSPRLSNINRHLWSKGMKNPSQLQIFYISNQIKN